MPQIRVVFFKNDDDSVPLLEWLGALEEKAVAKCLAVMELLKENGHDLRRPHADFLRDGICELRARHGKVRLRISAHALNVWRNFFPSTEAKQGQCTSRIPAPPGCEKRRRQHSLLENRAG